MSKKLRDKVEEAIKDSGIAHGQNISCASPLICRAAFENKGSALNRTLDTAKVLVRGANKTPQRLKQSYFSKMQHYNEFRKLIANGTHEKEEHILSKKNENIVLHGETTMSREAYTR